MHYHVMSSVTAHIFGNCVVIVCSAVIRMMYELYTSYDAESNSFLAAT